jgi:hypothetical protein
MTDLKESKSQDCPKLGVQMRVLKGEWEVTAVMKQHPYDPGSPFQFGLHVGDRIREINETSVDLLSPSLDGMINTPKLYGRTDEGPFNWDFELFE